MVVHAILQKLVHSYNILQRESAAVKCGDLSRSSMEGLEDLESGQLNATCMHMLMVKPTQFDQEISITRV